MIEQPQPEAIAESSPRTSKRSLAVVFLSLAGVGVATYLTYVHYQGGKLVCGGFGDCDYVNSSPYAVVAGVPVALFGLLAYVVIMILTLLRIRSTGSFALAVAPLVVFGLALAGVLFSAYLTYVELYILHAV